MSHLYYENVGSSKQPSHLSPEFRIQRRKSQHTKASHIITTLVSIAVALQEGVLMMVSMWFASGDYQSFFFFFSKWGNVHFPAAAIFISKAQCSFLIFSFNFPDPTILEFISKSKDGLFGETSQFLWGYVFLLWFSVCAWFLPRAFPGM